jgi:hypothetical protein
MPSPPHPPLPDFRKGKGEGAQEIALLISPSPILSLYNIWERGSGGEGILIMREIIMI